MTEAEYKTSKVLLDLLKMHLVVQEAWEKILTDELGGNHPDLKTEKQARLEFTEMYRLPFEQACQSAGFKPSTVTEIIVGPFKTTAAQREETFDMLCCWFDTFQWES